MAVQTGLMDRSQFKAGEARPARISIIVPAYNEEKLLPRTLAAMQEAASAFARVRWDWELIVCDNNSSDRTSEVARAAGARVVFEPVNQISRARNRGAAAATGQWLLFIDADSEPSAELFAEAVRLIHAGDLVFAGAVVQLDGPVPPLWGVLVRLWNTLSRRLRWMAGSFMLVEAAAFREIGGFNLELYASEELDLSRRLKALARRRGQRFAIITSHPLRSSARKIRLYSHGEIARFLVRAALRFRDTTGSRERCWLWYDGRR